METKETILYNLQHLSQLVFEVTDLCNLNCKYCALSDLYERHDKRDGTNLSFNKVRLILDYLFSLRDQSTSINYPLTISFYGGEPLLNMKLIQQIILYIEKSQFPNVAYSMTTNGMLLNEYMEFLAKHKFQLLISLDGNEANHSYRADHSGRNSFQRIFENIRLLQKKYSEYFKNYVQFNSVLHNLNSAEEIIHFIKNNFDKVPNIDSLNSIGISEDKMHEFKNMYQNLHKSITQSENCESIETELFSFAPRISNLINYIFKHNGNTFNNFNNLIFDIKSNNMYHTGTCSPFAKKMFITVNGKILQCERIAHYFSLGQILNNGVELDMEDIAKKQNQYISKINSQCKKCFSQKVCPKCVYNIEDICEQHPKCNKFSDKNTYELNKNMTLNYLREHPQYYEKILNEVTIRR